MAGPARNADAQRGKAVQLFQPCHGPKAQPRPGQGVSEAVGVAEGHGDQPHPRQGDRRRRPQPHAVEGEDHHQIGQPQLYARGSRGHGDHALQPGEHHGQGCEQGIAGHSSCHGAPPNPLRRQSRQARPPGSPR